jgi:hypothetical protein
MQKPAIFAAMVARVVHLQQTERPDVLRSFASDLFKHDREALAERLNLEIGALWGLYESGTVLVHLERSDFGSDPKLVAQCADQSFKGIEWHLVDQHGVRPIDLSTFFE